MMQQMPEFMENRFHFAMRQQRWLVANWRRQIPAYTTHMWFKAARRIHARNKAFHPRAIAFGFAWIPVRIKRAQQQAIPVVDFVIPNVRMPHRNTFPPLHLNPVEAFHNREHPLHHTLRGEVGTQLFLIKIVKCLPLFLRPVGNVPGFQFLPRIRFQRRVFLHEERIGLAFQLLKELHRVFTLMGHAVMKYEIRKIVELQQFGFLPAQVQNTAQNRTVIALRFRGPRRISPVEPLANPPVIEIGQNRNITRPLQSKPPAAQTLRFRILARR